MTTTRTMLALASFASAASLCGPAGQAQAAGPTASLQPHRAVYDLSLGTVRQGTNVTGLEGRMVIEFADACDGFATSQRIVTQMLAGDGERGGQVTTDIHASSWESKDGTSFRFNVRTKVDGEVTEELVGRANRKPDGSASAVYTTPQDRLNDLPAGVLFPSRHTVDVLELAAQGEVVVPGDLFDGTGDGGYFHTSTVIRHDKDGAKPEVADGAGARLLAGAKSWPIRIAFFNPGGSDELPEYELAMRLYANGIAGDMVIDYPDFSIRGHLRELSPLPQPKCGN